MGTRLRWLSHKELVRFGGFNALPARFNALVGIVVGAVASRPQTTSELRQRLGLPRRETIALLEELDRRGLTARSGDRRTLGGR